MVTRMNLPEMACTKCGHIGHPEGMGWGLALLGLVLIGAFIVPGLIYFAVLDRQFPRCTMCKQKDGLVPVDSPVGRRMRDVHPGRVLDRPVADT